MKRQMLYAAVAAVCLIGCRPGERLEGPSPTVPPRPPAPVGGAPAPAAPAPALPRTEPNVRVGITIDSTQTTVGSPVEFEVRSVTGRVLARALVGETMRFETNGAGAITARSGDRIVIDAAAPPLRVVPRDLPFVTIEGRMYRGDVLLIAPRPGRITAINVVDMEAYLLGVVPREMGKRPATEIEALKAQAIAARTYAVQNMGGHSNLGFDFYATILDQVYGGTADEDSIVSRAVRETRGEIMSHNGTPIYAYYASTCGGTTAAIEESWPARAPLAYLRSRSDQIPGTEDYYCRTSNRFTWKTEWTRQQLLDVLATTLRSHTKGAVTRVTEVNNIAEVSRGPSGRATVDLTVDGTTYRLRADSVRWVLRPTPAGGILNSSRLYNVSATKSGGIVDHLTIEGGGWGHAIGMCQVGAMARARAGQSYAQILKAYYTDITIAALY